MAGQTLSNEETIALIAAKAKAEGDNFWVKVFRRRHIGMLPEGVATFSDAQVIHFANPETWLPRIAGGGPNFMLSAFHANDATAQIGSMLQFVVPVENNPPKEIDVQMVKAPNWSGPRSLVYPDPNGKPAPQGYSIAAGASPAPTLGTTPQSHVLGVGQPGAFAQVAPPQNANAQDTAAAFRLENERARLETERARVEAAAREIQEQKRQMELDAIKRDNDARMREMELRLTAANARPPEPKGRDIGETIAAIGAVLAPVVTQMMQGQNEIRIAMMKQQEQSALAQAQLAAQAAERTQQMMQLMMARPVIDPAIVAILDKSRSSEMPTSQILHNMADAMGAMTQTTMDLVQTAADLNLGGGRQDDHPALKAIKEGVKAMNSLFQGYQQALPGGGKPKPQPRQAPQAPPPFEQAALAQPAPAAAAPVANAPAQFADAPASMNALQRVKMLVLNKADVVDVARVFVNCIHKDYSANDPSLAEALGAVDGAPDQLLLKEIGVEWAMQNQEYLLALHNELDKQARAAGFLTEGEPEEDDEEDDDDDTDYAETSSAADD